jgi:hypothetical protein
LPSRRRFPSSNGGSLQQRQETSAGIEIGAMGVASAGGERVLAPVFDLPIVIDPGGAPHRFGIGGTFEQRQRSDQ